MGGEEITLEDLLADEPAPAGGPTTFQQLLADGLPRGGGLEALAAIERMPDPGPQFAEVRKRYLKLLEMQRRGTKLAG